MQAGPRGSPRHNTSHPSQPRWEKYMQIPPDLAPCWAEGFSPCPADENHLSIFPSTSRVWIFWCFLLRYLGRTEIIQGARRMNWKATTSGSSCNTHLPTSPFLFFGGSVLIKQDMGHSHFTQPETASAALRNEGSYFYRGGRNGGHTGQWLLWSGCVLLSCLQTPPAVPLEASSLKTFSRFQLRRCARPAKLKTTTTTT